MSFASLNSSDLIRLAADIGSQKTIAHSNKKQKTATSFDDFVLKIFLCIKIFSDHWEV